MKINFNYIKAIIIIGLVMFLYGFAERRNNDRKLNKIEVQFIQFENLYVTEEAVNKLLIQNKVGATSVGKEALDLNRVESILNNHDMIENAEVFLTLDGTLKTKISQRKPIGRVLGNEIYYIDRLGNKMPRSQFYSARVPILKGVEEKDLKNVYPLLDYISRDKFLTEHITSISKGRSGAYKLELRKMDFELFFGKAERIGDKFNNFKAFYKKALKDDILNTYNMVDLQFGNQVVCTKK
ncbi:hypothetical protein L1I30_11770 [Gillisia sp. M10.2A]|uniref:Cell division protein FtsQ n=1 Tax=Gillisia lutea TaxID=2909668 RepID=A0ABS9EHK8_9FLAO|nr:hypothetical protein [Gillisia lutea]MCF4102347.1 hypothetical protein [Gillisia lutea]